MALTNCYVTLPEAQAYVKLNANADATELEGVVNAVCRFVDDYCQRHFYRDGTVDSPVTRTLVPTGACTLQLGAFNDLVSIATLKTDTGGDGTYETTLTNYGLVPYNPKPGWPVTSLELYGGASFPQPMYQARRNVIQIAGVWGWPSVPDPVKQACLILIAEVFKLKDAPLGVAGGFEGAVAYTRNNLPPRAATLLSPYRHAAAFGIA